MITVGAQLSSERVFDVDTIKILGLGLGAFAFSTMSGLIFAKVMNLFVKEKVNPLIGSAGVSAVPMAARLSHNIGQAGESGELPASSRHGAQRGGSHRLGGGGGRVYFGAELGG